MYKIEYAPLNYYHSPISDECLCIGILFYNTTTGHRDFRYISNFQRFRTFDDDADIDFVKLYLKGIKEDSEISLLNYKEDFSLESYIRVYANEFQFSHVKELNVREDENYVEDLTKIYLKYDLPKTNRLNVNDEKKLIGRVLKSNNIEYTMQETTSGPYDDKITFDYQFGNVCVKFFSLKEKNLRRIIGSARQWSFAADELSPEKTVLFIYDSDVSDVYNLNIILKILKRHAQVLEFAEGMEFILGKGHNL